MTELLYSRDCNLKEFDATVVAVNGREIELDRTAFYPNSGGQPDDTGILTVGSQDYIVSLVQKDKGRVIHHVDRLGIREGDEVHGQIDWVRRFIHMRYHTACHVLSGVVLGQSGAEITGNQIDIDRTRIDFSLENFDRAMLPEFEQKVNKVLKENHPVKIKFLSKEEAKKIPNVTKLAMGLPDAITQIRIISVEGFEQEACGGTHVSSTGDVGEIEILGSENKGRNNRRIYFRLRGEDA